LNCWRDTSQALTYQEASQYADDTVRNIKADNN
jgi:hypothetical protein